LKEQRAWRRFAHLPNRQHLPTASLLHDFRDLIGVGGLRRINRQLVGPLLESRWIGGQSVALIDSTDLPAGTSAYKKRCPGANPPEGRPWADGRSRPARADGLWAIKSTP